MKTFSFNHNDMCEVTLSKEGAEYLTMKRKEFYDTHPRIKFRIKEVFNEGEIYRTQFWDIMDDFGEAMQLGVISPFEAGKITIESSLEG